jgi:hypothetical protein
VAHRFIGNRIINSPYLATGPPFIFTDGVLSGWTAEPLRFERLTPTWASFCRPGALAPTSGTGRWSQSR